MTATAFGPQGPNYVTVRPVVLPDVSNGADTWVKNCSAPGTNDGTYLDQSYFNNIIGNLRAACRMAGVVLKSGDDTMLIQAMMTGMFLGTLTSTDGNTLTATLPTGGTIPLLVPGMRFSGILPLPNTGPMTLTLAGFSKNPGTLPVYKASLKAINAGDGVAGMFAEFFYDGTGFQMRGSASTVTVITADTIVTVGPNGNYSSVLKALQAVSTWIIASNATLFIQCAQNYKEVLNATTGSWLLCHPYGKRIQILFSNFNNSAAFPLAATLDGQGVASVMALFQGLYTSSVQANGVDAVVMNGGGIRIVNGLFIGDGTPTKRGFLASNWSQDAGPGSVNLNGCTFMGFGMDGLKAEFGGTVQTANVACIGNGNNGVMSSHGSQIENYTGALMSLYNGTNGACAFNGGKINVDGGSFDLRQNGLHGAFATGGSAVSSFVGAQVKNNKGYGAASYATGSFTAWNSASQFSGNASGDLSAYAGSYNYANGVSIASASPALYQQGNYGSYNLN